MKKKLLLMSLISVLVLSLAGCGREVDKTEEGTDNEKKPIATVVEPSVTEAPTPEPTEAPTPEPTEAPTPEPTKEPNIRRNTYSEEEIPSLLDELQISREEFDKLTNNEVEELLYKAVVLGIYGVGDNDGANYKKIGYTVSEAGNAFSEEYNIEAETVYDVLVAAGFYEYHDEIGELYINGVLIVDDPKNVPINNGDEISIEIYSKR